MSNRVRFNIKLFLTQRVSHHSRAFTTHIEQNREKNVFWRECAYFLVGEQSRTVKLLNELVATASFSGSPSFCVLVHRKVPFESGVTHHLLEEGFFALSFLQHATTVSVLWYLCARSRFPRTASWSNTPILCDSSEMVKKKIPYLECWTYERYSQKNERCNEENNIQCLLGLGEAGGDILWQAR